MSFTDELLVDIEKYDNNFDCLVDKLKEKSAIVIWGTGLAGTMVYHALKRLGIYPYFAINLGKLLCTVRQYDTSDVSA